MIYVIRYTESTHVIYEGVQQKIFEVNGRAVCPLYPIDNLIDYIRDVEQASRRNKHKSLDAVMREVDSSCAECMLVTEVNNASKIYYNQKFKDEFKMTSRENEIRNITTPFQVSKIEKRKARMFYPAETEIHILPSNYKNFFGNFSRSANEKNTETYELLRRYVDLFGSADCIISFFDLLDGESRHHKIPSFEKFKKVCDGLLTDLEFLNEKSPYRKNPLFYGEKEVGLVKGEVPPFIDAMYRLRDEFKSEYVEKLRPRLLERHWMTYTD